MLVAPTSVLPQSSPNALIRKITFLLTMMTEETSARTVSCSLLASSIQRCFCAQVEAQQEKPSEQVPNRWELSALHYS